MTKRRYTEDHAVSGLSAPLPSIEVWECQYPKMGTIEIIAPEYNAICPKTGLPDFGVLTLIYTPNLWCLELKSLKEYITAYRDVGIFYENVVPKMLRDCVNACNPVMMSLRGEFSSRGGIRSCVTAIYPYI